MGNRLLLVSGPGCPGCVQMKDRLQALGFYDEVILMDIATDRGKDYAMQNNIRSVPLLIKEAAPGTIVDILSGANHTDAAIKGFINAGGNK